MIVHAIGQRAMRLSALYKKLIAVEAWSTPWASLRIRGGLPSRSAMLASLTAGVRAVTANAIDAAQ
jgi:hypothetical protein